MSSCLTLRCASARAEVASAGSRRRTLVRCRPACPDPRQITLQRGDDLTMRPQPVLALVVLVILATGNPAAPRATARHCRGRRVALRGGSRPSSRRLAHQDRPRRRLQWPPDLHQQRLHVVDDHAEGAHVEARNRDPGRAARHVRGGERACRTLRVRHREAHGADGELLSLDPADEGKWDVVGYRVQRDTLELSGPWTYNGEKLTFTIRLARLK